MCRLRRLTPHLGTSADPRQAPHVEGQRRPSCHPKGARLTWCSRYSYIRRWRRTLDAAGLSRPRPRAHRAARDSTPPVTASPCTGLPPARGSTPLVTLRPPAEIHARSNAQPSPAQSRAPPRRRSVNPPSLRRMESHSWLGPPSADGLIREDNPHQPPEPTPSGPVCPLDEMGSAVEHTYIAHQRKCMYHINVSSQFDSPLYARGGQMQ